MSERTLLLGFDLGEEKSQMAVYDREKNIPVLIGQTEENPEGLIPTEIALSGEKPLRDFLVRIRRQEDVVVDGKISKPLNHIMCNASNTRLQLLSSLHLPSLLNAFCRNFLPESTPSLTSLIKSQNCDSVVI